MAQQYLVTWTDDARARWPTIATRGQAAARPLSRAHILLHAAAGANDEAIAQALHGGTATVERTRQRFVDAGLEAALAERPRPGGRRTPGRTQAAFLLALACRAPPDERPRWTLQRLADTRAELRGVESISAETVRRTLNQTGSSRGKNQHGASPRCAQS
jgi:transposase